MFCFRFHLFKPAINQRLAAYSTIFSLSSGHGKCGVSVIRVSGPCTRSAMKAIISDDFTPKPRFAALKSLRHPLTKEVIDRGLVLWFPGPHSFTGEDCCEFQVHGSLAVVAALYDALLTVNGLRLAEPGEFTKRAFFGGKLDLTEVEGLADLIHSETEAQRKQAHLQSTGSLSKIYKTWRKQLIKNVAHLEAYIDFAEDQNIEDDVIENLKADIKKIIREIRKHITDHRQGEMLRNGVKTVIIGAPNVGKSSLLNIICQKQVSIVTPIAGTTRDIIESAYNIGGYPVVFADTAGLRKNTEDTIENEGINRAVQYLQHTDLVLLVVDACDFVSFIIKMDGNFNEDSLRKTYLKAIDIDHKLIENKSVLMIANKIDLLSNSDLKYLRSIESLICVSCKENLNIDNILVALTKKLESLCGQPCAENPRLTHSRYRHLLTECIEHLKDFLDNYSPDINPDLAIAAEKLRKAMRCIERITGDVRTEEILDVIFRDFCIGK